MERPILFNAPMVRALLAGTKTQTRRVVRPRPDAEHGDEPYWFVGGYRAWTYRDTQDVLRKGGNVLPCPYGQAGDTLWVRETFYHEPADYVWEASVSIPSRPAFTAYRADGGFDSDQFDAGCKWQPSIHMPRSLSRITLEVTGVRVERLQDISEADAAAEGVVPLQPTGHDAGPNRYGIRLTAGWINAPTAAEVYRLLWEQINGPGSWDVNPWVWVVEFRRTAAAEKR